MLTWILGTHTLLQCILGHTEVSKYTLFKSETFDCRKVENSQYGWLDLISCPYTCHGQNSGYFSNAITETDVETCQCMLPKEKYLSSKHMSYLAIFKKGNVHSNMSKELEIQETTQKGKENLSLLSEPSTQQNNNKEPNLDKSKYIKLSSQFPNNATKSGSIREINNSITKDTTKPQANTAYKIKDGPIRTRNNVTLQIVRNASLATGETDWLLSSGGDFEMQVVFLKDDMKTKKCEPMKKKVLKEIHKGKQWNFFIDSTTLVFDEKPVICGGRFLLDKEVKVLKVCLFWRQEYSSQFKKFAILSRPLSGGHYFPINASSFAIAGGVNRIDNTNIPYDSVDIYRQGKFHLHKNALPWKVGGSACSAYMEEHDYAYIIGFAAKGGNGNGSGFFEINRKTLEIHILASPPNFLLEKGLQMSCILYFSEQDQTLKMIATVSRKSTFVSTILNFRTNIWKAENQLDFKHKHPKKGMQVQYVEWRGMFLMFDPGANTYRNFTVEPFIYSSRKENILQSRHAPRKPIFISKDMARFFCGKKP